MNNVYRIYVATIVPSKAWVLQLRVTPRKCKLAVYDSVISWALK